MKHPPPDDARSSGGEPFGPAASALRRWPVAAAVLSGVLLALCYAPFEVSGLVWVWQAPLLAALWFSGPRAPSGGGPARPRWRRGFLLGYLCGLAFFLVNLFWITQISKVAGTLWAGTGALAALAAYLAVYFGLFGAFAATTGRWRIQQPPREKGRDLFGQSLGVLRVAALNGAAWCGLEWLRGVMFTGFGWNGLGVALKDHLLLVQFADVIGLTGYGFVVMFSGTVLFATVVRLALEVQDRRRVRPHLDFGAAAALIIALFLYGVPRMADRPAESVKLRARIMQLNIPLADKWSADPDLRRSILADYRDLTRAFVEHGDYDIVLWPETSVPGLFSFPWVQDYLNEEILRGEDFHLLAGIEDASFDGDEVYNTIVLMQGDTGSYQMYRKIHLVPLGEYIPLRGVLPVFEWIAGGIIEMDFTPGDSYEPLSLEKDGHRIGIVPLVCFEDTVPRHARRFVREEPQILVNVTNDGWFYDSAEPAQHFHNALFRCIELRRPMIRATNTGVSAFIDERGSVYDRDLAGAPPRILRDEETGSTYIRGSLPGTVEVDLAPRTTVYARVGDAFSVALGSLALACALLGAARRRPARPDA